MTFPLPPAFVVEYTESPQKWLRLEELLRSSHPLRDRKAEDLARARDSLVAQVAREQQVPVLLALGLAQTENTRGIPWAVSQTGDVGLMQLNARAQQIPPSVLADRRLNVELGLQLLRQLYERSGSWNQALKAYNLGPTGARRSPKAGESYVNRVRGAMRQVLDAPFQRWYRERAGKLGLDPDPDNPQHYYDYRAAYRAGAEPDESGHWPSEFKREGHPRLIVEGRDTRTGKFAPGYAPSDMTRTRARR